MKSTSKFARSFQWEHQLQGPDPRHLPTAKESFPDSGDDGTERLRNPNHGSFFISQIRNMETTYILLDKRRQCPPYSRKGPCVALW